MKLFFTAAILLLAVLIVLDIFLGSNWRDILVEAHGLLFDVLFFGIILTMYEVINNRRRKIEAYREEIDDFRFWQDEEASYRIVGLIRRLNKLGISKIKLDNCNLEEAALWGTNLEGSTFREANMRGIYLRKSNVSNCYLAVANLKGGYLMKADFSNSDFTNSDLSNADLRGANFTGCNFTDTKLNNAKVDHVEWISKLQSLGVIGFGEIADRYYVQLRKKSGNYTGGYDFTYYEIKARGRRRTRLQRKMDVTSRKRKQLQ